MGIAITVLRFIFLLAMIYGAHRWFKWALSNFHAEFSAEVVKEALVEAAKMQVGFETIFVDDVVGAKKEKGRLVMGYA